VPVTGKDPSSTPWRPAKAGRPRREYTALGVRAEARRLDQGLHIVATPIGNLSDISLRALETLAAADAILAEDTRLSRRLLDHYSITTPLSPYHDHNGAEARPKILSRLRLGEALALICDAGTPLISDPGYKLVAAAVAEGIAVHATPGANAAIAALTVAGLPTDRFLFEGFLPHKTAARRERLNSLVMIPTTLVFYEAPSRLAEALADMAEELGPRRAAVARELTKLHEEIKRGDLAALAAHYAESEKPRGEIVVIVAPPGRAAKPDEASLERQVLDALQELSVKDAAAVVAAQSGLPRREVYSLALRLAGQRR
jgi:16S rRNA (cytidine1402-2'-O)-methyltransferase